MNRYVSPLVLLGWVLAVGCNAREGEPAGHGHEAHGAHAGHAGHGADAMSFTHFGGSTELFVEFPPLVRGQASTFAAHLSRLSPDGFQAVGAGTVTVILSGGGAPDERFEAGPSEVTGIFRPVATPSAAGERALAIELASEGLADRHDLGPVAVYGSPAEAQQGRSSAPEAPAGGIAFLKEQQWKVVFATAPVEERSLRASATANGLVRARPDGEACVAAPEAGRLLTVGPEFPRLGQEIRRDEVLAVLAPRVRDADRATLDLAVTRARVELERAVKERERLEGLFASGAVPERRVVEARLAEQAARAEVASAGGRVGQYEATQRVGADGAVGRLAVRSPIDGVVVKVHVTAGAYVEEGALLFDVVDLDRLWLEVQIPESELARVKDADEAWFTAEGFAQPFVVDGAEGGRRVALGGQVDPVTRTVPLVFEIPNPDRRLAAGAFARVHVVTGDAIRGLAIPVAALQEDGGLDLAYVQVTGESFDRRVVRLGVRDGGWVQVLEGLRAGERVVTEGSYYVRLASSSSAIPAHGHAH